MILQEVYFPPSNAYSLMFVALFGIVKGGIVKVGIVKGGIVKGVGFCLP